jgi:hypothetical protein
MGVLTFTLQLILVLLFALSAYSVAVAQEPLKITPPEKQINESGWQVPDLTSFKISYTTETEIEGVKVSVTHYDLGSPKPVVEIAPGKECEVRSTSAFAVEVFTFAISSSCVLFGVDPRYGKFYIGAEFIWTFYDEDGDGIFESKVADPKIIVPEYLRKRFGPEPLPPPPPLKFKRSSSYINLISNSTSRP